MDPHKSCIIEIRNGVVKKIREFRKVAKSCEYYSNGVCKEPGNHFRGCKWSLCTLK